MMPVHVIRKTRSVGVVPQGQTIYEVLEDLALTVQSNLVSDLPFCAFNGAWGRREEGGGAWVGGSGTGEPFGAAQAGGGGSAV